VSLFGENLLYLALYDRKAAIQIDHIIQKIPPSQKRQKKRVRVFAGVHAGDHLPDHTVGGRTGNPADGRCVI
jgi:hypothetical protein